MEENKPQWGILALIVFIALLLATLLLPPLSKTKARASRIQGVNNIASVTITLSSTNALPPATEIPRVAPRGNGADLRAPQ